MQLKFIPHLPYPASILAGISDPLSFSFSIFKLYAGCAVFMRYGRRSTCDT